MFSAYLWGIETWTLWQEKILLHKVFSVPMRNWNQKEFLWRGCPYWFSAYLWGIETSTVKVIYHLVTKFSAYLWGIETPFGRAPASPVFRFQRTYEELKLDRIHPAFFVFLVFSVPMRNWNCSWAPAEKPCDGVFSVPMRNWNNTHAKKLHLPKKFSAYLWGIETLL